MSKKNWTLADSIADMARVAKLPPVTDTPEWATQDNAPLLARCQQCRNAMGYLLDGSTTDDAQLVRLFTRRLAGLRDRHNSLHKSGSTSDTETPRPVRP